MIAASRRMPMSQRLSPVWFIGVMLLTFAVVTLIAWLVHGDGDGPSDDFTLPGPLPVLTVGEVLRAEERPAATATVIGRLKAVIAPAADEPAAESLGGPMLVASQVSLEGAEGRRRPEPHQRGRSAAR